MNLIIFIGILIIIIILIYFDHHDIIEGYDARYTDFDFEKCARFCKTTKNCYGFGYNPFNKICYPSALPIQGRPLDSIFKDEYTYTNATCNKIETITEANNKPSFEARRKNSVYSCTEDEDKQPQFYIHNNQSFRNIGEGRNIDDIFDIEFYEVRDFTWPRNRFNYNQTDLLIKVKENQTFVPTNVTDLNRIMNFVPEKPPEESIIKPKIVNKKQWDFDLDKKIDNLISFGKSLIPNFIIPKYDKELDKKIVEEEVEKAEADNPINYAPINKQNMGEYLFDHECTKNIPIESCRNYCSENSSCVGFEFNPQYGNDSNVCCPYKTVGSYSDRTKDKENGTFYLKK